MGYMNVIEGSAAGCWNYRWTFTIGLESYISGMRIAHWRMAKEAPETNMLDEASVARFLQPSGFTSAAWRQVLAAAGVEGQASAQQKAKSKCAD